MQSIIPPSFIQALAGILSFIGIVFAFSSLFKKFRTLSIRLCAIMFIGVLALFSNHISTYFASIFIIATAVTELEFLQNLAAIIRGNKDYFNWLGTRGNITREQADNISSEKASLIFSPMEYKILNTLWTKQINKFPDFKTVFTFIIYANSSEYLEFREAGSRLVAKRLISETPEGQYFLTPEGIGYCKKHYLEFKDRDQWWPEETLSREQLDKALGIK